MRFLGSWRRAFVCLGGVFCVCFLSLGGIGFHVYPSFMCTWHHFTLHRYSHPPPEGHFSVFFHHNSIFSLPVYIALPRELQLNHRLVYSSLAGGERVFKATVGLVVAPHDLFVADSGRAARLPLEVRLPDSNDPLPLLCRVAQSRMPKGSGGGRGSGRGSKKSSKGRII